MTPTVLTSDAKEALRRAVRGLRARLIEQLTEAAKGEYRLDVALDRAQLPEARRCRRQRLEIWLEEQVRSSRGPTDKKLSKTAEAEQRQRFLHQAAKEAAHTLLNRLVVLRILEHHGVLAPAVVTGGWSSPAYEQEFVHYAGPLATDDTRGYRALLDAVFAELAIELPGLFGPVGLTPLFPVPVTMLRDVIEALNDPALASAWGDDTTLGWVYQYWNDPEREQLDAKIAGGGKIEPHEIASKTQMFTERYMVEWLLQNSLGLTWLAICKKNGWTPDAESALPVLEARRAEWRAKREAGEVALDELMPVEPRLESAWKYYVPQPIPEDAVAKAPLSIREVRLLDPACGSGHFLVIAFGLLADLYLEEARHRDEEWSSSEIAESILANNLHGIDIDPRAIQIAAAALALRAKLFAPEARVTRMNLVAPCLRLGDLPADDPALAELCIELECEAGISQALTRDLVKAFAGVDYLGSLFKIDDAIRGALSEATLQIERGKAGQGDLFRGFPMQQTTLSLDQAKQTVLEKLEQFLAAHSASEDLGLRLHGEQLASGVRFVRLAKEGTYDIVFGNPPYQGLGKATGFEYVAKQYPRGKADLYAAFLDRGLELARPGGMSAMVTMQGWMFLGQYSELRRWILDENSLRTLADLMWCAFENMRHATVAMAVTQRGVGSRDEAVAVAPTDRGEREESIPALRKKRAALLAQVGRYEFDPTDFRVITGEPLVYWWTREFKSAYVGMRKLRSIAAIRKGLITSSDARFIRRPWECAIRGIAAIRHHEPAQSWSDASMTWAPLIKGASGRSWMEGLDDVICWRFLGLAVKVLNQHLYGSYTRQIMNEAFYFSSGVAFTTIGNSFRARVHRYRSVIGSKGSSVYPFEPGGAAAAVLSMNTSFARKVLESLNPGIDFQVGDVNRLPIFPGESADEVFATIEQAFAEHESHREPSVEFKVPGPSPWRYTQEWAQRAVDRPDGAALPTYEPDYDAPAPEAYVSFAIGVALGRFGANGEGVLDQAPADALPAGILFVGPNEHFLDSLRNPASERIARTWEERELAISGDKKLTLRDWLRKEFFAYHKDQYDNRPIYFPLSSERKSFVAWVSIHRWADNTLQVLLADHLLPLARQLDGEISDLSRTRASSDKKTATAAEKRYATVKRLRDELGTFIDAVTECAERGAPPTDPDCAPRAANAPFHMDLDDGVMINSAALWPLLAPQWNDPKKWWKQFCQAKGKDYDWSHLARRYFPARVEEKCLTDPSLAVAHGCFWKYHPAKAYAWELRLQDEIRPDFTIDEADSNECRERFLRDSAAEARALQAAEHKRRERKAAKEESEDAPDGELRDADADAS